MDVAPAFGSRDSQHDYPNPKPTMQTFRLLLWSFFLGIIKSGKTVS
jgi:hypothetical protein